MAVNLEFLPKSIRGPVQAILVAVSLIVLGWAAYETASSFVATKAQAAVREDITEIRQDVRFTSCAMRAQIEKREKVSASDILDCEHKAKRK